MRCRVVERNGAVVCDACGESASFTVHRECPRPLMGDRIAAQLRRIGVKPCEECDKRRERLNRLDLKWRAWRRMRQSPLG